MNGYVPKVGDKVKATFGESVNVGEVVDMTANNGNCVHIELGVESWAYCDLSDGWLFEQVVSVPTKFGAVIRNHNDKQLYVRHESDVEAEGHTWIPLSAIDEVATDEEVTAGGFTVLFEGVDE